MERIHGYVGSAANCDGTESPVVKVHILKLYSDVISNVAYGVPVDRKRIACDVCVVRGM